MRAGEAKPKAVALIQPPAACGGKLASSVLPSQHLSLVAKTLFIVPEVIKMAKDSQGRKWQITINNPVEKGYTHDKIKEELSTLKSLVYYCMTDEVGQTHHTHIFVAFSSGVRFSTLKTKYKEAHFEIAHGTSEQNRDYIAKTGKWENDKKHGTSIAGTFEEYGEIPIERQGARNDLANLYDLIKSGVSNYQIIEDNPEYMFHLDKIERARQTIKAETYKDIFIIMEVTYIWGETGTGKTRSVMEKFGYSNVYRVTDYAHPFDAYTGEDVGQPLFFLIK